MPPIFKKYIEGSAGSNYEKNTFLNIFQEIFKRNIAVKNGSEIRPQSSVDQTTVFVIFFCTTDFYISELLQFSHLWKIALKILKTGRV